MRQLYRDKWQRFNDLVVAQLHGLAEPVAESAGMHLVLQGDFDDQQTSQWLRTEGFGSAPLSAHFMTTDVRQGLVMGFASAHDRDMVSCVDRLVTRLSDSAWG